MVSQAMQQLGSGEIEVLVDNEASRENVTRAAQIQGWSVAVKMESLGILRLILKK
jgi:TusA-related sulfurtransferase